MRWIHLQWKYAEYKIELFQNFSLSKDLLIGHHLQKNCRSKVALQRQLISPPSMPKIWIYQTPYQKISDECLQVQKVWHYQHSFLSKLEICLDLDGSNFSILDLQRTPMSSNLSFVSHSSQPTSKIQTKRNSNSMSFKSETSSQNLNIIPQRNSIIENEKGNCRSILVQDESELQVLQH